MLGTQTENAPSLQPPCGNTLNRSDPAYLTWQFGTSPPPACDSYENEHGVDGGSRVLPADWESKVVMLVEGA